MNTPLPDRTRTLNGLTVDVEEHFQVSAFDGVVSRDSWAQRPSRVRDNTSRLLDLFDEQETRATFFVLGWIGERYPELVRQIADRGHEVASHGYSHQLVYNQTESEFREETERSRRILQDASGQAIFGYRAASFSIGRANLWALDTLVDAGFRYDSSLFPIVHDRYGIPGAERRIHELTTPRGQPLIEIPPSTVSVLGMKLPVGGGGYLRIFPLVFTRWAFRRLNREGTPAIVYVHPWEVDPDQPRLQAPPRSRFRHYTGLRTTASKLRELTSTFRFGTLRDVLVESGLDPFPEQSSAAELTS
jgi:polysaccharide deacetylase family protein (PEP-CTERM system associated)